MPVSQALRRLLRVRTAEEEQRHAALESTLADLHALERALAASRALERRGRARAASAETADRIAARVEFESAARHAVTLSARIECVGREAARLRVAYLEKRVERRQVETVSRETEARDRAQLSRRAQQEQDDRFGRQHQAARRAGTGTIPPRPEKEKH